jgi:hypothetical protein
MQFLFLAWILHAYSTHPASFIKPNNNTPLHMLLQVQTFSSLSCSQILPIIYFYCYLATLALTEGDRLGDPSVDVRIIVRWIFRKWDVGVWAGLSWLRIGTGGGHL